MIRMLDEREIKDCVLFGVCINPRFAYTSREGWYSYLKSLNNAKLNKIFERLERHNKTALNYKHLSDYIYKRLIEKSKAVKE